jgi:hypothetical protein
MSKYSSETYNIIYGPVRAPRMQGWVCTVPINVGIADSVYNTVGLHKPATSYCPTSKKLACSF